MTILLGEDKLNELAYEFEESGEGNWEIFLCRKQLKKVVEYIDNNFYIGVGCDGEIEYEGDYERWQALKEEAGIT